MSVWPTRLSEDLLQQLRSGVSDAGAIRACDEMYSLADVYERAQTARSAERYRYTTVPELAEMDRWLTEHVRD